MIKKLFTVTALAALLLSCTSKQEKQVEMNDANKEYFVGNEDSVFSELPQNWIQWIITDNSIEYTTDRFNKRGVIPILFMAYADRGSQWMINIKNAKDYKAILFDEHYNQVELIDSLELVETEFEDDATLTMVAAITPKKTESNLEKSSKVYNWITKQKGRVKFSFINFVGENDSLVIPCIRSANTKDPIFKK